MSNCFNFSFKKTLLTMSLIMVFSIFGSLSASGQVTTARVQGTVMDENSDPLPGANVVMVHNPTGTRYGTTTEKDGRFNFANVRVGGPYKIKVSFVGYRSEQESGFQLDLGESRSFNFQLKSKTEELGEVTVTADEGLFSEDQQGISTTVSTEEIENAPTIDRSIADFARLTPQAVVGNDDDDGSSISIAGQNNRYNSIFIDGAVANDVFGLSATGTDGGQTGASVISMDAVEQFNIEVSPYDVTQSYFGGGAINAVTRSGTNDFKGSFAFEYRDEALSEDLPSEPFPEFTNKRYVGRLGGPIIKDELFFFVNFDINREQSPQPFQGGFEDYQGETVNNQESLDKFLTFVDNTVGDRYDPGSLRGQSTTLNSDKFLGKIDWNISQSHKLMARYSYSESVNVDAFGGSPTNISFSSRNEVFPNETQIFATELNSTFGSNYANSLTVSYKSVKDDRDTNLDKPFPSVQITDGAGEISLGGEMFSTVNFLEQDVYTVSNDFNVFLGDHTVTVGTHNEYYDLTNKFVPFNYGWYFYNSVEGFAQSVCAATDANGIDGSEIYDCGQYPDEPANSFFLRGFSLQDNNPNKDGFQETIGDATNAQGAFSALNSSLYVQDEWSASDRLTLTGGLRVDIPIYLDDPQYANTDNSLVSDPEANPRNTTIPAIKEVRDMNGARPGETPDANPHWSPRLGFNFDLKEEYDTQVRGGTGVFTSRQPFVWPGGMYLNNGTNTGIASGFGPNPFRPNPQNGLTVEETQGRSPSELVPSGRLEMFESEYMNPRFWRSTLAVDHEFGNGWTASIEGQWTETLKNIKVTNVNLRPANETLDGPDNRPIWVPSKFDDSGQFESGQFIDSRYTNIHRVGNTSRGYSYDVTGRLRKTFKDVVSDNSAIRTDLSYTYGDSYSVNDGLSSQINSVWAGVEHVNGANNPGLARSDFSLGHRVLAQIGYKQQIGENVVTDISLIYDGQSGRPFSYVIGESYSMVREGNEESLSLFYVPNDASNLTFAETEVDGVTVSPEQQAAALNEFVSQNEHLSSQRGTYSERNGDRTPWEGVIDLNARVEIFHEALGRKQSVELTANIFNFSSLLGDVFGTSWGNRYIGYNSVDVVEFQGFKDAENGNYTPVYTAQRVTEVSENGEVGAINQEDLFQERRTGSSYSSQWQMKFGVRYNF